LSEIRIFESNSRPNESCSKSCFCDFFQLRSHNPVMKRQLAERSNPRSSVAHRTVKITFGITSAVVTWTWNYIYYNCQGRPSRVFCEEVTCKAEFQEHLMWKWWRVAC